MEIRKLYINGEWVDSVHDEWIEIENPATHEIIAKVPRGNKEDVDKRSRRREQLLKHGSILLWRKEWR